MTEKSDSKILKLDRVFTASITEVYAAWTDVDLLEQWWTPRGSKIYKCEVDLKIGGKWRFGIDTSEGNKHEVHGEFTMIKPLAVLEYTWAWDFESAFDDKTLVRIEFEAVNENSTRIRLTQKTFDTEENCHEHSIGWKTCFESLDSFLA